MKLRLLVSLLTLALVASLSPAHGDKKHVLGKLEKISATSLVVRTTDGKSVEVKLVPATSYVLRRASSDKPAHHSDLAVGDNVVVHATPKNDTLEADEVKFSPPGAKGFANAPEAKPLPQ
ncbi:MAG: hypothetical protein NVS9B4_05080 [Candidatus Acidiferrum sp.]